MAKQSTTADQQEEMLNLYATGLSIREVAIEVKRSYGLVHGVLTRAKVVRSRSEGRKLSRQRERKKRPPIGHRVRT